MAIESSNGATVFTGEHVSIYRLLMLRSALKAEEKGLQMIRGVKAIRPRIAEEFGLSPRAPRADFIARCSLHIEGEKSQRIMLDCVAEAVAFNRPYSMI